MLKAINISKHFTNILPISANHTYLPHNTFLNAFFGISSVLTDKYPQVGSFMLDKSIELSIGNKTLLQYLINCAQKQLSEIDKYDKILVIGDLNIGDAINIQSAIYALKDFFPNTTIDYVINPIAENLLKDNKQISNLLSWHSALVNDKENLNILGTIVKNNSYDLILNFCPFLSRRFFNNLDTNSTVINTSRIMASLLMHNEYHKINKNHVIYQSHSLINKLFKNIANKNSNFNGVDITIKENAFLQALDFLSNLKITGKPFIMYNPDASSHFTRVPLEQQVSILTYLADSNNVEYILLGAGHTKRGIEFQLIKYLNKKQKDKIHIIPAFFGLDVYAALIDLSSVFITPDTGVMHIAAAKKHTNLKALKPKNRTAIISIFGATPATIYGYDSINPRFFDTNQDAAAKVFIGKSLCRNITCINKNAKTCKNVRCFLHLDTEQIANYALKHIKNI